MKRWSFLLGLATGLTLAACGDSAPTPGEAPTVVGLAPPAPVIVSEPPKKDAPFDHAGGTIARIPGTEQLVVASEELEGLALLKPNGETSFVKLPGPPGQLLASPTGLWVTVRSPGRLLLLNEKLEEKASLEVPTDAWGLALTPDGARLLVTSAWSHKVTILDAAKFERGEGGLIKTLDVPREPRAIAIAPDGSRAFITHLTSSSLTRVDGVLGEPEVRTVEFPASPLRAPSGKSLSGSLSYAALYSADGSRLYVGRHALGAMGRSFWFGAPTVDVLTTADEKPLAPSHVGGAPSVRSDLAKEVETPETKSNLPVDFDGRDQGVFPFVVPRDLRARPSHRSLLVVGESSSTLAELDADALNPSLAVLRTVRLGMPDDPLLKVPSGCAAPSGIALSEDEKTAFVACRTTFSVQAVNLETGEADRPRRFGSDPLGEELAKGRRLFFDGRNPVVSGGLSCAGCHPEGRDDGHTWHEATFETADGTSRNFTAVRENIPDIAGTRGVPRRTPMIAERINAKGPYGWLGESPTLAARLSAGFGLHRWGNVPTQDQGAIEGLATLVGQFARTGLKLPPRERAGEWERGKAIFESKEAACATCHTPETDYTNRVSYPIPALLSAREFDVEAPEVAYKVPSLIGVGEHAPYFHDGSSSSLEHLIRTNGARMGSTAHLSADDARALADFLRSL